MKVLAFAIAVLIAASSLQASIARANPRPENSSSAELATAQAHFRKGEKLYALGRFAEALKQYQAAFEAAPLPEFLFNIGQCYRNLGDYDQAIFSFRKYLDLVPNAKNRRAVGKLISELEDERAEARKREAERKRLEEEEKHKQAQEERRKRPPAPPKAGGPIYTKWWFYGGIAAVGVAAVSVFFLTRDGGVPDSDLGNLDFPLGAPER